MPGNDKFLVILMQSINAPLEARLLLEFLMVSLGANVSSRSSLKNSPGTYIDGFPINQQQLVLGILDQRRDEIAIASGLFI
jgi:hypothetical protein